MRAEEGAEGGSSKRRHLLQHASAEAHKVERGEDVAEGSIKFLAQKGVSSVEIFVVFHGKQDKIRLVEETHDEQEYLVAVVEFQKRVGFIESALVRGGASQSSSKHEKRMSPYESWTR